MTATIPIPTPSVAAFGLVPYPLNTVLIGLVQFYVLIIIVWAVLSWFNQSRGGAIHDIYEILDRIVSPFINLFRRFIPTAGGMDFSPLIAIILLQIVLRLLV
jgi:uncharacterized protein YggT (Ycf19 family)